jgi:hypothetical protein
MGLAVWEKINTTPFLSSEQEGYIYFQNIGSNFLFNAYWQLVL